MRGYLKLHVAPSGYPELRNAVLRREQFFVVFEFVIECRRWISAILATSSRTVSYDVTHRCAYLSL